MSIVRSIKKVNHGLCGHKLYVAWNRMIDRCFNKNNISYKYYGGRGVRVCKEWAEAFLPFYNWAMANGWSEGLELDKDIKGDGKLYSPETCCFVTRTKNRNRKRSNVVYNGQRYSIRELADEKGIYYMTLLKRINAGWPIKMAVKAPIRKYKKHKL